MAKEKKKGRRKISEYFKIIKKGKEKLVKKTGYESVDEKPTKKQVKEENIILRNVFITLGILILIMLGTYLFLNSINNFEYRGVEFDSFQEGNILFYHTSFPTVLNGTPVNYNAYIRNDPRELEEKIPFKGSMNLPEIFVLDSEGDFSCDGFGGISTYNMQQILGALGSNTITDPNATCDSQGRYGYLRIQEGNLSGIGQFGPACYLLQVNDCEILEVTERLLTESLVKKLGNE